MIETLHIRLAPWLLAIIELAMMGVTGALIFLSRHHSSNHPQCPGILRAKRAFNRLAKRPAMSTLAVGAGILVVRATLIPIVGIPQPRWHDEYSYLLAADTFAHGRLTNPTHPMWTHFESFHIIQRPTYMSMYPPAQGLVLAAGQLFGQPWLGQLVVTSAMCSILCWALRGWLPPRWALLGAILAALRLGILSYWMNTYWCASIAALGGALVLGAWPRLRRNPSVGNALLLGLGLVILANSRPYEGFVFTIPIAGAMMYWLIGAQHPALSRALALIVVPILFTVLLGGLASGWYYHRVTGSAFEMTYQVNRDHSAAPYFIWQTPRTKPEYRSAVMRDFYRREFEDFRRNRTFKGYVQRAGQKFASWWQFYLGPLLTVPLLAFPWIARDRKMALPLILCGAMIAGFAIQTWTLPHYFAPATAALYILLIQALRHLWLWRWKNRELGRAIVSSIPMLAFSMILLRVFAAASGTHIEPTWPRGNLERATTLRHLRQLPGQQLVIVRYGPYHDLDNEWVWNEASIDAAKVVWARDLGQAANGELLQYFSKRRVWTLSADDPHPELVPYLQGSGTASPSLRPIY